MPGRWDKQAERRRSRWFAWLLLVLAAVVVADGLHVFSGPAGDTTPPPKPDVLGRVITRGPAVAPGRLPLPSSVAPTPPAPVATPAPQATSTSPATVTTPADQPTTTAMSRTTTTARTTTTVAPTTTTVVETTTTTTLPPVDPPTTEATEP